MGRTALHHAVRPLDWTLRVVSKWVAPIRSQWHPSRLWIGYASSVGRFVMPLAKFFYGDTHKWYFRSAAAASVATYVTFVAAYFDDKHRWILYLIAFGGVTGVYWFLYAPAKWIYKDTVQSPEQVTHMHNRTKLIWHQGGDEYEYADELLNEYVQGVLHKGNVPASPSVPVAVRLLHYYIMDQGKTSEKGPYRLTRQWRPPGFWHGYREYRTLYDAAHRDIADSRIEFIPLPNNRSGNAQQTLSQLSELAKAVLYLDDHSPKWRQRAQRWDDGGRVRVALQESRALVSRTFGQSARNT